ncbi:MAG: hypothetical protein QOI11_3449 [Candidatus Eremiobacteraeota bacterium]|jgi:hypothetical protein|nr:hypothetical protein [Candidatus Eremiobacteraeota bacterium]
MSESRFDDLDLREEPASATKAEDYNSIPAAFDRDADASVQCTRVCCV